MKTFFRNMASRLFALLAACVLAIAQTGAQAQPAYSFSQQELDRMLAPIALYPDALLSQILMAATYPMEVVEAARWARARPDLSGDAAVLAAEGENWDPSVKSLVAFPQVLVRMGEDLQWMQALGDAFLAQQAQVMDTVQALRRKAQAAGNLRSDDHLSVVESGPGLLVQPLDPQVVYVPYYDPLIVYGSWWWPASPPVYLRPWPGHYARPAYAGGFYWGPPVGVSAAFFFGSFDWPRRQVRVAQVNNYYYRHSVAVNRAPGAWHHEPEHRRGIAYRGIEAQQRFGGASAPQGQGNRARPADPRGADERMNLRPAARPEARPEARSDGRRRGAGPAAETPANAQPAAPVRRGPIVQPAPAEPRLGHRRETRGTVQPAQPAPVIHPAPVIQPAPAAQPAPASRGNRQAARPEPGARHEAPPVRRAPIMQAAPAEPRFDHRRETRAPVQPAQPAPVIRPAPVIQPAPAAQPAPASRGNRQAARPEPGARREAPRAAE